ncbi:MAG: hypothetical protein HQL82_13045 [Magnetococcales bacterium]|nr:hypothetical protein [Magnetococcales bacterium]
MIRVFPQGEPVSFDARVRQKGLAHMRAKGIDLDQPLPSGTKLPPYWRGDCLRDLYRLHGGICAYLGVFFEEVTGAGSVDHSIAKSKWPRDAYEWDNYRLACRAMNTKKRDFSDVLDPFCVENGWFQLNLSIGSVHPDPALPLADRDRVMETIKRLDLNDPAINRMRAKHYGEYARGGIDAIHLKETSPFVWHEAVRQGLL